jgi:hypothetical protein
MGFKSFGKIIILMLFLVSAGDIVAGDCFVKHINDAIKLNQQRRQIYRQWGGARAVAISQELVLMEKLLLIKAYAFDRQARQWQKKGIPFLCRDLIDMQLTPPLPAMPDSMSGVPEVLPTINFKVDKKELKENIKKMNWPVVFENLESMNAVMAPWPYAHCLTRHFVESKQRSAFLTPQYLSKIQDEKEKNKFSRLMRDYQQLHTFGLAWAKRLDRLAYPLQKAGIPILCRDVPPIDVRPQL